MSANGGRAVEAVGTTDRGNVPSLRAFQSALIVKPSSLGDIVHTLPAVHAIRQACPHLRLRWLANTEWMPLLQGSAVVDEVIPFPRKTFRGMQGIRRAVGWARQWRHTPREKPEIVLDFQGLLRSALISRARGSRPIVGLSDAREGAAGLYDHLIRVDAGAHAVDRYLELPRALGIPVVPEVLAFPLPAGSKPSGLPDRDDWIAVHPWSRGKGKSLEPPVLQALCDALKPLPVVIVGMRGDAPMPIGPHLLDLSNRTTLPELIWVLRRTRFNISVDSGPMHIAAAVNDNTLGIHTWTDPRKVGPYNPAAWIWKAGRIGHRRDFSAETCLTTQMVTAVDARAMAQFVHQVIGAGGNAF